MTHPLVRLQSVCKSYDETPAVADIDLSIWRGEFVAVMGSSGSGKTTLIKILAGFETPDRGDVLMNGTRINEVPPWQRQMPMVWQSLALFPFLNVVDNVEFGLKMRGLAKNHRRQKSMEWLERLNMAPFATRAVTTLSGGQRQRVALARTLVMEPEILLLDEPLSALDANMVLHMEDVLSALQKELSITFLYVTHSRQEAFAMADRVVLMNKGRIQQTGSPYEIYHTPRNRFVAGFVGNSNIFSGHAAEIKNGRVLVRTADGDFWVAFEGAAPAMGVAVAFVVPAAEMDVLPSGEDGIPCRVRGEEFAGGFVVLRLTTAGGVLITAQIKDNVRRPDKLNGGDVRLRWPSDQSVLLREES